MGTGITQGIGIAIAHGIGNLINAGLDQIGKATQAAEDFAGQIRRVNVVFGDSADDIRAWASTANTSLGLTERAALSAASSLGSMLVQMGAGREEAATLSKQMVEAARDVAAFNRVSGGAAVVLETFAAAFRGEYDSLQRYLPAISDAAIKQQALAESGKKSAEQLTATEKALATQTLILRGATIAGDAYAQSLQTAEGQQERFTRRIEDGLARVGQIFLPIKRVFFQGLNELVDLVEPYGNDIMNSFASGLAKGLVALTPFFAQLRQVFVTLLESHSPPKLLPELTAWGQAAMQEYLRGWTLADFDALRSLGGIIESVVRSFAGSGNIAETDLVSRIFGTQRTITQAVREFRTLGQVSEATLGSIADAAGPAGTEVAGLVREYFQLEQASKRVKDAQDELNNVTREYANALDPINQRLGAIRERQEDIRDQQELEGLGKTLKDPRALASDRELARLRIEEIRLADHAEAIESERDTAVDAATAKINAAQAEADAQRERFGIFQQALEQQTQTNALIGEEIALRERIANEVLAAEEKARRELEEQQRREAATLERLADAQLAYRLQLADTEGDLEIMRGELAKVTEGSAEYFQILTQIAQLEERLAKERESSGGGLLPTLDAGGTGGAIKEATGGFKELEEALKGIFATAKGEGGPVKLSPAFEGIVTTIQNIGKFAQEATPLVRDFINVIMGKDVEGLGEGGDPFAGNFWLAGLIPFLRGTILTVQQILDSDWAGIWQRFKDWVDLVLNIGADDPDGTTNFFYGWLKNTFIPVFEDIIDTDWAKIWTTFETTVKGAWDTVVGYIDTGIATVTEAFGKLKEFYESLKEFVLPGSSQQGPGYGEDALPPSNFSSFPGGGFPGIAPLMPALAGATSSTTINHNETFLIEQVIGMNDDLGGARAGAQTGIDRIRDDLINRRLHG